MTNLFLLDGFDKLMDLLLFKFYHRFSAADDLKSELKLKSKPNQIFRLVRLVGGGLGLQFNGRV